MTRTHRRPSSVSQILLIASLPASLVAADPPRAWAAFNQATCTTSTFDTAVPTEIGALEFVKQSTAPAGGSSDMTRYNHNIDQGWHLVEFNTNVQLVRPFYGYFETELNNDALTVVDGANTAFVYSGSLNSSTTALVNSNQSWNVRVPVSGHSLVSTHWVTDASVANFAPPNIAQVAPRCRTSQVAGPGPSIPTARDSRIDGVLIKTSDTIYFNVPQRAFEGELIRLDTLAATPGADFDLYVATSTTTPDNASFQWRGFSGSASEALFIPAPSQNRTLFIGVHSFSGAGHFALSVDAPKVTTTHVCVADATGTRPATLSSTQLTQLKDFLRAGSVYLYGFSDGILFRNDYKMNTAWANSCTTENGCDMCAIADDATISTAHPVTGFLCGHIDMHGGNWSAGAAQGWLYAHESGHSCFGLADQYKQPPAGTATPRYCGHTTMANNAKATAFCEKAHCRDGQVFDVNQCDPNGTSDWAAIRASPWAATYTGSNPLPTPAWNNPNLKALVSFNF